MSKGETIKSAIKFLIQKQIEQGSYGFSDNNDDEVSWDEVLEWIDGRSCDIPRNNLEITSQDCISREEAKQFLYERIDRLNDDELYDI